MSEDYAAITLNTYNHAAKDWMVEHNDPWYWVEESRIFKKLLPSGNILDIGCGYGRDCHLFFPSKDYTYLGLDFSSELLREARWLFPSAQFIMADMRYMPFAENSFDGFWASASLLHIEKNAIREVLNDIKRIMRDNAMGFIALKKGEGEGIEVNNSHKYGWAIEDKRFFAYYDQDEF
jgi:ubiquinone/menaquinone biosynthesis C-methylase UbiE